MRRRRNADAPSSSAAADAVDVSPADPAAAEPIISFSAADPPAVDDASAPPVPRRRSLSARRGGKTAEPTGDAPVQETAAPVEAVAAPEEPEPKKPARRRKAAAAVIDAAAPSEPAAETTAEPPPPPLSETPPQDAAPQEGQELPPAKSKRGGRRRTQAPVETVAAEPENAVPAVTEELVSTAPVEIRATLDAVLTDVPTAAADNEVVAPARPNRRRNSRRSAADAPPAEPVVEVPPAEEVIPPPTQEAAPPTEPASSRQRGQRRRSTPAAESADAAAAAATPSRSAPAPAPAEPTSNQPRRVRGVPRSRETAAAATGGSAAAAPTGRVVLPPAPLVEPLPPPYQPLPAAVLARLPDVRIVTERNRPILTVNGEARLPLWFFVNTQDEESLPVAIRQIRMAYEAGIRFFSLLAHLPWKTRTGERRFGPLDDVLQMMAENAPDALLVPRLIFSPPASWERANAGEMTRYTGDNEPGDVSFASRLFWEGEADEALRAAIEHVAQSDHAHRVAGFYLEHGEWLHEKERGPDISEANVSGFRAWLKTKYKMLVNLRAAWHDGSVTFENAEIPTETPVLASQTLFWGERQQRWADLAQYGSETAASVIVRLAKSAKEASGNRSAVAVSYGYTLEIMRGNSGHNDLARVLASPHVDILTGPVSYSGRLPGGSAPLPVPLDSVHLAGKLWISEDDTKTFLASGETPDTYNPKITAPEGTWAVHSRNFGTALARGAGLSWMDLWGEGWLDDRYVWENIAHLNGIAERLARLRRSETDEGEAGPDVAVFVDEKSFFDVPPANEAFLSRLVADQRDVLLRSGAKIGFYLLSDLLNPNFPKTPRLLLFLNAFHLPDTIRTAIKAQQDDGKTLAWLFGPGCRDESVGESVEAVGLQIRLQPWGSKTGTTVLSSVRSPLTENLRGQKIGDEARINPSFYVVDPKATVLGEYVGGLPALAYRKHPRWQSVFLGEPGLTLPLLRGLFKLAGVPVATVDDDAAVLGDGLLSLHSAPGGGTTVYLPEDMVLYDLLTSETVASGGFGARLSLPPQGTRLLFGGTPGQVRALGGDPDAAPYGLNEDELPPAPPAFVFENVVSAALPERTPPPLVVSGGRRSSSPPPSAAPEDADLMAAAFASGDFSLADKQDDGEPDEPVLFDAAPVDTAAAAAEAEAKKKRRRRRRGPNRTSTAPEGETDAAELVSAADEGEAAEETEPSLFADNENAAEALPEPSLTISAEIPAAPVLLVPPGPPVRLTLEELLPQSTLTEEQGELPPVPDELLPLDTTALTAATAGDENQTPAESDTPNGDSAEAAEPPRKRRGRPRRTLPAAAEEAGE